MIGWGISFYTNINVGGEEREFQQEMAKKSFTTGTRRAFLLLLCSCWSSSSSLSLFGSTGTSARRFAYHGASSLAARTSVREVAYSAAKVSGYRVVSSENLLKGAPSALLLTYSSPGIVVATISSLLASVQESQRDS
jgi:hypothetical protein